MEHPISIGSYLLGGLSQAGVQLVFGIPGDYILGFYGLLRGYRVSSMTELEAALQQAVADNDRVSLLNVRLRVDDPSPAMRRLGA